MLYCDRVDIFEVIAINKTFSSLECKICDYSYCFNKNLMECLVFNQMYVIVVMICCIKLRVLKKLQMCL